MGKRALSIKASSVVCAGRFWKRTGSFYPAVPDIFQKVLGVLSPVSLRIPSARSPIFYSLLLHRLPAGPEAAFGRDRGFFFSRSAPSFRNPSVLAYAFLGVRRRLDRPFWDFPPAMELRGAGARLKF